VDTTINVLRSYLDFTATPGLAIMILAAAAVFAFSLGISGVVSAVASPLRRRLQRVSAADGQAVARANGIADLLRPVARYVIPAKVGERSRIERALIHAGFRSPGALSIYYGTKALLMLLLPLGVLVASPFVPRVSTSRLMFVAGFAAFLGSLIPSLWLDRSVRRRQRALRVGFPDALDLLVVCVEAGLGLAPALQRVSDDLIVSHPELGNELALVNAEMRAGVERTQALKNLADRTGLDDIRGLVALLVQTMRFGTGVADALRVYSEEFRDKRMQAAEEQAALIGTKMIFPLVACLFPSFFLVMVGPAIVRLIAVFRTFSL
jgi:tight adherence protein C